MKYNEIITATPSIDSPSYKASYRKWRAEWRTAYKALTLSIRKQKASRKGAPNGYVPGLDRARSTAREMMECLSEAQTVRKYVWEQERSNVPA